MDSSGPFGPSGNKEWSKLSHEAMEWEEPNHEGRTRRGKERVGRG
jgi:hypothetical protein